MLSLRTSLLATFACSVIATTIGCAAPTSESDETAADETIATASAAMDAPSPCAGTYTLEVNGYTFDLLVSGIHGGDEIIGAMFPHDGNPSRDSVSRIDGFCNGDKMSFTRYMPESRASQSYVGFIEQTRNWNGAMEQVGSAGHFGFRAFPSRGASVAPACNGAWQMSANGWAFDLVVRQQNGNGEFLGAMLPKNPSQPAQRVVGTCGPQRIDFTRYMDGSGNMQSYHGGLEPNGTDWGGTFNQPGVGQWSWDAHER